MTKVRPWRREWQPTPVFLIREFHGQRSLAGYSAGGRKESDTTEHACIQNETQKGIFLELYLSGKALRSPLWPT